MFICIAKELNQFYYPRDKIPKISAKIPLSIKIPHNKRMQWILIEFHAAIFLNLMQWNVQSWSDLKLFLPMWSIWKLTTSRNNFKKLQIRLFKLQISPIGNIACRHTFNHSKKKREALEAARPIGAGAYPGFCAWSGWKYFYFPWTGC